MRMAQTPSPYIFMHLHKKWPFGRFAAPQHGCHAMITPGWHVPPTSSCSCSTHPCHPIKNRSITQNKTHSRLNQPCQVEEQNAHMATHRRHQNSGPILSFWSSGQSSGDYWCGESESLNLKKYMTDLIQQTTRSIIKKKSCNIHFVLAQGCRQWNHSFGTSIFIGCRKKKDLQDRLINSSKDKNKVLHRKSWLMRSNSCRFRY